MMCRIESQKAMRCVHLAVNVCKCETLTVLLYACCAIREAILLYTTFAVVPMPPAVEKGPHFCNPLIISLEFISTVALGKGGV